MTTDPTNSGAPTPANENQGHHHANTSLGATYDFERGRRRARLARQDNRRKAARELDAWGYAMPSPERRPCDYLLSDGERRAYARYLVEVEHWANWEVRLVLTAPGVRDRGPRYGYTGERVAA